MIDAEPVGGERSTTPLISVVITAYRRRHFLRSAVESVLQQSLDRRKYQVIVVKDFSDPELDRWLDSEEILTITQANPRVGGMLAAGVSAAVGDVVCFLDDDDRFKPEKLERVAEIFAADVHLGFVRNAYEAIDEEGKPLLRWSGLGPPRSLSRELGRTARDRGLQPLISRENSFSNTSTMSIRRAILLNWLADLALVRGAQDTFLAVVALLSGRTLRLETDRWNHYRVHASTSHPMLGSGGENAEIRCLEDTYRSARQMVEMISRTPRDELASRIAKSLQAESKVVLFLLGAQSYLSASEWFAQLQSAVWRRQAYMLRDWILCSLRSIAPGFTISLYRAKRSADLRRRVSGSDSHSVLTPYERRRGARSRL